MTVLAWTIGIAAYWLAGVAIVAVTIRELNRRGDTLADDRYLVAVVAWFWPPLVCGLLLIGLGGFLAGQLMRILGGPTNPKERRHW